MNLYQKSRLSIRNFRATNKAVPSKSVSITSSTGGLPVVEETSVNRVTPKATTATIELHRPDQNSIMFVRDLRNRAQRSARVLETGSLPKEAARLARSCSDASSSSEKASNICFVLPNRSPVTLLKRWCLRMYAFANFRSRKSSMLMRTLPWALTSTYLPKNPDKQSLVCRLLFLGYQ